MFFLQLIFCICLQRLSKRVFASCLAATFPALSSKFGERSTAPHGAFQLIHHFLRDVQCALAFPTQLSTFLLATFSATAVVVVALVARHVAPSNYNRLLTNFLLFPSQQKIQKKRSKL
ncbi:unnamed protein product [Ceratitis capitata]|uniref:(Mediterranean fruit fly) hypothetical protein n=1 Tax=Ceratitis capitata TaxID=7213 RepID=A0A811TYF6_CERCA|nr:unnamed protein product [Ceratitis capitata]